GTKAEIPSESTAATCRTSSQHVLLLSAPVSESYQIPDGKGTDCYNLQREQKNDTDTAESQKNCITTIFV
ncbi:hypothetical protein, partial [Faecalibacterium prausnitzii]|uniref:hypothetical protein n=1 Tax=Faecalibacterium prausnitzii TaxID=853 RepID=UPI00356A8094